MEYHANQNPFTIYSGQEITVSFEENLLIFFGLKGNSTIICSKQTYELEPSGILAVNPFEVYKMHCPIDASVICFRISKTILDHAGWTGGCYCYVPSGSDESKVHYHLKEMFAEIFQTYFERKQPADFENSQKILEFLHYIKVNYPASDIAQQPRESTMRRLGRILELIESRWNEDISLSEVAEKEYLSVSYLSRFFQKNLYMSFSQYLKELRLSCAMQMLVKNNASVTRIAYDCGFHAPSVFIEAFKQQYGQTPGQYRQQKQDNLRRQADPKNQNDARGDVSVLLAYAPEETKHLLAHKLIDIAIDSRTRCITPNATGRRILNIGYARDGLMAPIQSQIFQAQKEIGFEFIRFHGLFDEDMHIYWEDRKQEPQFSFYYLDMLFDFIQSAGLKPFVELGFMPSKLAKEQTRIFDRPSIISGCIDLEKWSKLVRATVEHLLERYGQETVRQWKFTTVSQSYVHLQCVEWEDYKDLYETTYRTVKSIDEKLEFGGPGCFAELIDREQGLPLFLEFVQESGCIPDFISFQCYPHVHTYDSLFMDFTLSQQAAPAILSEDPDYLRHSLDRLEIQLEQNGLTDREIYIEESTSTLWQRDLSGDTCYKAVWLAKNMADSCGRAVFGYWLLTDLLEERAKIETVFHGGYGLTTYNGIPKAGYQAMKLFGLMGSSVIGSGDGWLMTRSDNEYQLIVYNYCHYSNLYRHRYQRLQQPEDAYSVFETGVIKHLRFAVSGLDSGTYRLERRKLNREHGSSFDNWIKIGSPQYLSREDAEYLTEQSRPICSVEPIYIDNILRIESILEPHEVELLCFRKVNK